LSHSWVASAGIGRMRGALALLFMSVRVRAVIICNVGGIIFWGLS
jgi:hypothetical protein